MSTYNIDNNNIPLNAYLRADPHTQIYRIKSNHKKLVTKEMFWGTKQNSGLYLDYSVIPNRSIEISDGISDLSLIETKYENDCDKWINNNLLNKQLSKLFVIRGYAGCGKSTFINFLNRNNAEVKTIYIDIGQDWAYPQEPYLFFNESLNEFDRLIQDVINSPKARELIWKKFIQLGNNEFSKSFEIEFQNIITRFCDIKKEKKWKNLKSGLHSFLLNHYSEKNAQKDVIWNAVGQTQVIVSLIILLQNAINLVEKHRPYPITIEFDNLDMITNPAIPAENVLLLWGVVNNYNRFRDRYENKTGERLIDVKVIIAVRKVLYSHIISHLPDQEMLLQYNSEDISICDISNLYISQKILEHRISFWKKHPVATDTLNKLQQLDRITKVYESGELLGDQNIDHDFQVKTTIDLDALFNHNYRAFSNILSILIDDLQYSQILLHDYTEAAETPSWKRVSTQIFLISYLYRKEKIWNAMGFGCKDFSAIDYPTTLNRLILNYLFIAKRGHYLNQQGIDRIDIPKSEFVSLKDCLDLLSKIKIVSVNTSFTQTEIDERFAKSPIKTEDLILERLSEMCARNPMSNTIKASGYDSDDDELWRRPLYFVGGIKLNHTATSKSELKDCFRDSIKNNNANSIKFSITDEGFILIRDVVADFEFYSARYCEKKTFKPLHQSVNSSEIDSLIDPVYEAIKRCCIRNGIFMEQYTQAYGIDNKTYLTKPFHPRTNPRFTKTKDLIENGFREQLHIVRVIYNHCYYFDKVKESFYQSDNTEKNEICKALTNWIEEYLTLFFTYFNKVLKDAGCTSDINIYYDLWDLLKEQKEHYAEGGDYMNVNINRGKQKRPK